MKATRPGKPTTWEFTAEHLVRAIFDSTSDEAKLLELSALNIVELHASGMVWNKFLWLMMNVMKDASGSSIFTGAQLGSMKNSIPVIFH
jgi:hypothetical protein